MAEKQPLLLSRSAPWWQIWVPPGGKVARVQKDQDKVQDKVWDKDWGKNKASGTKALPSQPGSKTVISIRLVYVQKLNVQWLYQL